MTLGWANSNFPQNTEKCLVSKNPDGHRAQGLAPPAFPAFITRNLPLLYTGTYPGCRITPNRQKQTMEHLTAEKQHLSSNEMHKKFRLKSEILSNVANKVFLLATRMTSGDDQFQTLVERDRKIQEQNYQSNLCQSLHKRRWIINRHPINLVHNTGYFLAPIVHFIIHSFSTTDLVQSCLIEIHRT